MASRLVLVPVIVLATALWAMHVRYDRYRNSGILPMIFSSTLLILKDFDDPSGTFPTYDTGDKIVALSMVFWPGVMWAIAAGAVVADAEDATTCSWLILSPLLTVLVGLPILRLLIQSRRPLRDWRIATGLATAGIVAGHFVRNSSLGQRINHDLAVMLSPFADYPLGTIVLGISMITYATTDIRTCRLRAADNPRLVEKLPTNTLILMNLPPSACGWSGPILWTLGLALCTSSMVHAEARAAFVAASVAIYLTIAVFPPFLGKIWVRYEDWLFWLVALQAAVVNVPGFVYSVWAHRVDLASN
jgi:hypothetical protein